MNPIGLYLHVPFCFSKCAYCDFYSNKADEQTFDRYTDTLCEHLALSGAQLSRPADTLYIGGGTPSLLGGKRIARLVTAARNGFGLHDAEITAECNPKEHLAQDFQQMAAAGVNRLSLGVQSAAEVELRALSRRHRNGDVIRSVKDAKQAGIHNISLDLMFGIPYQTLRSLKQSLDFLLSLEPTHISAYMLKIEPNTPFGQADVSKLHLPNDDQTAEMYLYMSDYLKGNGFEHYEISNFAKPDYRSRHNTKYWLCEEYLGLGPAAYSYLNGKRFSFDRDTEQYLDSPTVTYDGDGGDFEEYAMLRLRLSDGINLNELTARYGRQKSDNLLKKAAILRNTDLIELSDNRLSLTVKGFLVSNAVIGKLLY